MFNIGDEVSWSSQGAGNRKEKVGTIVFVVPPRMSQSTAIREAFQTGKINDLEVDTRPLTAPRSKRHENSYLIETPGFNPNRKNRIYQPWVKHLKKVQ